MKKQQHIFNPLTKKGSLFLNRICIKMIKALNFDNQRMLIFFVENKFILYLLKRFFRIMVMFGPKKDVLFHINNTSKFLLRFMFEQTFFKENFQI